MQPTGRDSPGTFSDGVLILDGFTLNDVDAHLAGEDEEQARWFGWYPKRSTVETVTAAILRWQENWRTGGTTRTFAVREASHGTLVGGCEIRFLGAGVAHASYWIFPPFRRRGLGSRALLLLCEFGFGSMGIERIELYVEPDNAASRGVARRAGFAEDAVLAGYGEFGDERRDMIRYTRSIKK
ncbi:MAG TPA: GNAT family protein [Chloroflexota bacterium]|nr:GNAT family protein [Chloroflexota bacterium]